MKRFNILLLCAFSLLFSCSNNDVEEVQVGGVIELDGSHSSIVLDDNEYGLVTQNSDFAFRLLKAVDDTIDVNEKIAVSPLSLSMLLSMLANGAEGDTYEEILKGLGYSGYSIDEINAFNKKLLDNMPVLDKAVQTNIANALWINKGVVVNESFSETLSERYSAEISTLDFSQDSALGTINDWCSKVTGGKINNLLPVLPDDQPLVLANALYFKAPWSKHFDKVFKGKFETEDGDPQQVKYMKGTMKSRYYEFKGFAAARIEYANMAYNYTVVLPNKDVSINDCIAKLASGALKESPVRYAGNAILTLTMPVYDINFKMFSSGPLSTLGINDVFSSNADFSGVGNIDKRIMDEIIHACYFSVDEYGTEGGAASITGLLGSSTRPEEVDLVVDRPFLFFVQEQSTGVILFIGKVSKI